MRFFSDNAASVHPAVLEAVSAANAPDTAYDGDAISGRLDAAFSDLFETQVSALWVATGTAANCLALAALCPPYRGTLCASDAHINQDEAGAPEFYSGGGKLITVDAPGSKLTPALVEARLGMRPELHARRSRRARRTRQSAQAPLPHGRRTLRQCRGSCRCLARRSDL